MAPQLGCRQRIEITSHLSRWGIYVNAFGWAGSADTRAHRCTLTLMLLWLPVALRVKRVSDWVWALGVTRGRNVFVLGSLRGRHLLVFANLCLSHWDVVGGRKRKRRGRDEVKGRLRAWGCEDGGRDNGRKRSLLKYWWPLGADHFLC